MIKHQANCYRNINRIKYMNYADLIYGEVEVKVSGKTYKAKIIEW